MNDSPNTQSAAGDLTAAEMIHTLARLGRSIWYRRTIVAVTVIATLALGIAYYATAPRIYQSTANLYIVERHADKVTTMGEQMAGESLMTTQRELVTSPVVLQAAIEQLAPQYRLDFEDLPPSTWIDSVRGNLSARDVRKTNMIELGYRSRNPEAAAAVVSAVLQSYLNFMESNHRGTASENVAALTTQLTQWQAALKTKQNALQTKSQTVGAMTLNKEDGLVNAAVMKASRLQDKLLDVQDERRELDASLAALRQAIARGDDLKPHLRNIEEVVGQQLLVSSLGLSPQDLESVRDQEVALRDTQEELGRVEPYLGPAHPRVAELKAKAAGLQQYLTNFRSQAGQRMASLTNGELGPMLESMLVQNISQVQHREGQLTQDFNAARNEAAKQSGDLVELEMLRREVDRLEQRVDSTAENIAKFDLHLTQGPIQVTVTKEPLPAQEPISPKLKVILAMSLAMGVAMGVVFAYVQDVLDDRFNSIDELAEQLNVPVLAIVRQLDPLPGEGLQTVHTHVAPTSVETEAFRTLRTSLKLGSEITDRILVSSAEPGDGKTTVSANLAVAFAQSGRRTLVLDCDLRRPGMTALLDLKGKPGVFDVLSSSDDIATQARRHLLHTDQPGLDIIPAGLRRPDPAELLASPRFVELLAWADAHYDQILVDCPPVLAVSDAQIVGRLVDGAVLVVRPEKNHRRLVVRACEQFRSTGVTVFGVVANGISEMGGAGYGYGYDYQYGYGHGEVEDVIELPRAA